MAVLNEADRAEEHANFMRIKSQLREGIPILKGELRAAVDAVDDWVEANQGGFNAALPLPARTVLTAAQKAELLLFVVRRRWEVS